MNLNTYYKTVLNHLETNYHLPGLEVEYGGRHPRIELIYNGVRRVIILRGHSRNVDNFFVKIQLQQVDKLLGGPPVPVEKVPVKRNLEMMMAEIEAKPFNPLPIPVPPVTKSPEPVPGSVAYYSSNSMLMFRTFKEVLSPNTSYDLESIGPKNWRFIPGGQRKSYRHGKYSTFAITGTKYVKPPLKYFNSTAAEFVRDGDDILVRLIEDPKERVVPSKSSKISVSHLDLFKKQPQAVAPAVEPRPASVPKKASTISKLEESMLKALEMITEIEVDSVYRLTKVVDGSWEFRAPSIRLKS